MPYLIIYNPIDPHGFDAINGIISSFEDSMTAADGIVAVKTDKSAQELYDAIAPHIDGGGYLYILPLAPGEAMAARDPSFVAWLNG